MVGVEDEKDVQGTNQGGMRLVFPSPDAEQHVQKVRGVGEPVLRIDVGQALVMPEGEGRQRRHLGQQTDDLNPPILRVVHLFGVRVEG